jgi:hypothetical protein
MAALAFHMATDDGSIIFLAEEYSRQTECVHSGCQTGLVLYRVHISSNDILYITSNGCDRYATHLHRHWTFVVTGKFGPYCKENSLSSFQTFSIIDVGLTLSWQRKQQHHYKDQFVNTFGSILLFLICCPA